MSKPKEKIGMLLDISNIYGTDEGRLGPFLITAALIGAPFLLWVYLGFFIPLPIFIPLWLIYSVRVIMIIPGHEKERLDQFKRQVNDQYSTVAEKLRIKTVHTDGLIEWVDGTVAYCIVATNTYSKDDVYRAQVIHLFLLYFCKDYDVDTFAQNITETKSLEDRYSRVKLFNTSDAANDFLEIIDNNRKIVYTDSLHVRIVFMVKGSKSSWKDIRAKIESALLSYSSKVFKTLQIADYELCNDIVNHDVDGIVDMDTLFRSKYARHDYHGSRVLYYDDKKQLDTESVDINGFMEVAQDE